MFRFWLHFHPLLILLTLLLLFAASGAVVHWLQCHSRLRPRILKCGVAAPTFVAVSTLFALFASFLLAGGMAQKSRALQAVQNESAALISLNVDSEAAKTGGESIRSAIRDYARSVVTVEWPLLLHERGSPQTAEALLTLMRTVRDSPAADNVASPIHSQMLTLVQKVVDGRSDRVAVVSTHLQQLSWTALFLLGMITQFGLGMAHLERGPNMMAIGFFSLGAVVGLWLIAIQDNPFRGLQGVSPAPIEAVIAMVPGH
jgi:hypothetical protein